MKEKWYSLGIEDIEKKLNTNAFDGLDEKKDAKRIRRRESGSIYLQEEVPLIQHVSKIALDITAIIFFITALIGAFFGDRKTSLTAVFLLLSVFVLLTVIYLFSKRYSEKIPAAAYPKTRVVRSGKVLLIDSRDVVEGDLILIETGDVIPCDCRLTSSNSLRAVEFVGKVGGKEKYEVTEKDADAIYSFEERLSVSEQKNMIGASAVVISGSGSAIAVRAGRNTFISAILGAVSPFSAGKKEMKILASAEKIFSKVSLAFLIAAVPITIVSILLFSLRGKTGLDFIGILLSALAVALTSASEMVAAVFCAFPSFAMSRARRRDGTLIKFNGAVEEMNYLDSVMLMGNKAICDTEKRVESIFAGEKLYDAYGDAEKRDAAFNCLIDLALLGSAPFLTVGARKKALSETSLVLGAKAISSYGDACGIDQNKLFSDYELVEFSPAQGSDLATTLVKSGDEYRVICVSGSSELLSLCTHIRTPEGAVPLDIEKRTEIISACDKLTKKGKSFTLVASRISPCSSLSRLGAVQNQLILEGYIAYRSPYPDSVSKRIEEMREAEISFFYIGDETAESVITAFNIGAVKRKQEIAYASSFRRHGKNISSDFGQYKAYLGFSPREIAELARTVRGSDGTLAIIASETDHYALMNEANVAVALADMDRSSSGRGVSEILKKNADVIIPAPRGDKGGFEAFCRAVIYSKNACKGIGRFFKYLLFSASMRTVLCLLPLLAGDILIPPVLITALWALVDIPFLIAFAALGHTDGFGDGIEDVESEFFTPLRFSAKYIACGGALGVIILLLSAVFGSAEIASGSLLSVFSFIAAMLSQISAALVVTRNGGAGKGFRIFFTVYAVLAVLFIIMMLFVSGVGSLFGIIYPGWQSCVAAPLAAVIGYVMMLVIDRYI